MSELKPKPSEPTKTAPEIKKPGLEIKPVQELELDQTELEKITGGNCAPGTVMPVRGGGFIFSDAALKSNVAPIKHALAKLRELRF